MDTYKAYREYETKGFLRGFLKLCREYDSPIDFVSWHVYSKNPYDIYEKAEVVRRVMSEEGVRSSTVVFDGTEHMEG